MTYTFTLDYPLPTTYIPELSHGITSSNLWLWLAFFFRICTHTHTHTHIYIYMFKKKVGFGFKKKEKLYIYMCVCIYNKSMILPIVFHWGYIGLYVYGFQVVHSRSLEQVNIAIMFSFGFVYIKSMNKVILDLAHGFLWGYILNPRFAHSV